MNDSFINGGNPIRVAPNPQNSPNNTIPAASVPPHVLPDTSSKTNYDYIDLGSNAAKAILIDKNLFIFNKEIGTPTIGAEILATLNDVDIFFADLIPNSTYDIDLDESKKHGTFVSDDRGLLLLKNVSFFESIDFNLVE